MLSASLLYNGHPDYFSGHASDSNSAVLWASYTPSTSLQDLIDEWASDVDSWMDGPDRDPRWATCTDTDIRLALLAMLYPEYRAPDKLAEPCELARDLGTQVGHSYLPPDTEEFDCPCDYCTDVFIDLPQAIVLLELLPEE